MSERDPVTAPSSLGQNLIKLILGKVENFPVVRWILKFTLETVDGAFSLN